jgi:hypothetical protein
MRPSLAKLVEAARALRLTRHPNTHGLRIGAPPAELPVRLLAVLEALEAHDAEGANASVLDADPAKVSEGIDAVFRWIAAQGLATDEPLALLAKAMGKAGKRPGKLVPIPAFAPGFRKKGSWKPKLGLARGIGDGLASLGRDAENGDSANMRETVRLMGHASVAMVEIPAAPEPESLTMGPC